jgi:hypothetical protein
VANAPSTIAATSFIYVIGSLRLDAPVKIGVSTVPARRLRALRTGHHDNLLVLARGLGGSVEEQALHRMFATERLRGEWFKRSDSIIDLIAFLKSGGLVRDLIAQWGSTMPVACTRRAQALARERFMQRQVKMKVEHNEWDTVISPAEWQKEFEDGRISMTEYARVLASLAAAPKITEAEKADIERRQHALAISRIGPPNAADVDEAVAS